MKNKIIKLLKELEINNYIMNLADSRSVELFFIKRSVDMRREADVSHAQVTVFRDFEKDGKKLRGQSVAIIHPTMNENEIRKALSDAYFAASFVCNPYFELPDKLEVPHVVMKSEFCNKSLNDALAIMTEALFASDNDDIAFINSAELFVKQVTMHVITSAGTDASYTKHTASGEFVVQCKEPTDVEFYKDFSYNDLCAAELSQSVHSALESVKARANAKASPPKGEYDIILSEEHVATLLSYYLSRSSAHMVYAKYSNYAIGDSVQGESIIGEKLCISLTPKEPVSDEGIMLKDYELIKDGKLMLVHGGNRFSRYLGVTPTGIISSFTVNNGSKTLAELQSGKCLHIVAFSDFQIDALSGYFGGEIRLAYLYENGKVTSVTGGSINGSIIDKGCDIEFSKERYINSSYNGPHSIRIKGISVAGE